MALVIEVVEIPSLGDRTYLVHDGEVAVVVDPQRDIDRVLAAAGRAGVRISHVAETHLHNDYVSGGLALARVTGADYLVAADEDVAYDRTPVSGGDRIAVSGEWVVDLRTRKAFAVRHLAGTISFGVDGPLATWLGWLLPPGAPLTLLGESPEQVATAQRELARIGVDRPAAAAVGLPDQGHLAELRTATFAELAAARPAVILDVRTGAEWRAGHIGGARHIPLPHLTARLAEVPAGEVWVHCAAGYRAAAAASLLLRAGREAVHVDDDWPNAAAAGLPIVTP